MKPAQPWSTVTAAAYPLAGLLGYLFRPTPEGVVFALAMLALGLGTGWRHWSPSARSRKADQISMHLVFAGLCVYAVGGGWYWMALGGLTAGVLLEWKFNLKLRPTFGLYVALLLIAVGASRDPVYAGFAAAPMAAGLYVRDQVGGDLAHSFWHDLTAAGLFLLFYGLGP